MTSFEEATRLHWKSKASDCGDTGEDVGEAELIRDIQDRRQSNNFQSKVGDDESDGGGGGCNQTSKTADHPRSDLHQPEDCFPGNDLQMGELPMDC